MKIVTIREAKAQLSRLIKSASRGEEIIITRRSKPVARLVSIEGRRKLGSLKGKLVVGPEFFQPLPADDLKGSR